MTGPDASSGEMPGFPFPRPPAAELDESLLDALLTGCSLPPGAPEQARTLADLLASLADPAVPGALAGEAAARSAFARAASPASISPAARRPARRKPTRPGHLTTRLAAALAAAAVALAGATAAAAYAGALPGPIQELAHHAIGAPAAHQPPSRPRPGPQRPPAPICSAYQRAEAHGPPGALAADRSKLATAAGGAAKISSYCAALHGPRAAPSGPGEPGRGSKANAHGKPTAHGKADHHANRKTHARLRHRRHPRRSRRPKAASSTPSPAVTESSPTQR